MDLILWRHAEATEAGNPLTDLERPLTPKGERQAARMAEWLARRLPSSTRVLASPARRTQQTAAALERKVRAVAAIGPAATVESLLSAAGWPDANEPVLVVGHQPTLGLAAATLLCGRPLAWAVRKGGIVWLRHRRRGEVERVLLVAVLGPELL